MYGGVLEVYGVLWCVGPRACVGCWGEIKGCVRPRGYEAFLFGRGEGGQEHL